MERKITLRSSDGEVFEVDVAVAMESQTIKRMIEDDCAESGIPLPNVNSRILAKVVEYCKKHVDAAAKPADDGHKVVDEELKNWDAEFVKVDQATLFDLILAANYLDIKGLLDLTCQAEADRIEGETPEEIRETPTENQELRAFEGRLRAFEDGLWVFENGLRVFERGLLALEEGMRATEEGIRTENRRAFAKMLLAFGQVILWGYSCSVEQERLGFDGGMRALKRGIRPFEEGMRAFGDMSTEKQRAEEGMRAFLEETRAYVEEMRASREVMRREYQWALEEACGEYQREYEIW